jgi:hypothetical protein
MYLIVDKKTNDILHMSNSFPGEERKPEEIFPAFDARTMEFGRAPEQFIPVKFAIHKGVVKDLDPPKPPAAESLEESKAKALKAFSDALLAHRREQFPDHQLLNAGLGIYEDDRVASIKEAVQAYRDEYHRLEKEVAKAKSHKDLGALVPAFPSHSPSSKSKTTRKAK